MNKKIIKDDMLSNAFRQHYLEFVRSYDTGYNMFNKRYSRNRRFLHQNILKISFGEDKMKSIIELAKKMDRVNFARVAWYHRKGEKKVTLLIVLNNNCVERKRVAWKVFRTLLNRVYDFQISSIDGSYHDQILMVTKFLLYHLFNDHHVLLKGELDPDTCVLLERGRRNRLKSISKLLHDNQHRHDDDYHEIDVLRTILREDPKNDLGLVVCSSILVKSNENPLKDKAEFDGMILYPNRESNQVVFVESKNTTSKPSYSKNCLIEKFEKLGIDYNEDEVITFDRDCRYLMSI